MTKYSSMTKYYPQEAPSVKDNRDIEHITWMVANEYYEVLASKKNGKALRVDCHRATERFLQSMESLRSHA